MPLYFNGQTGLLKLEFTRINHFSNRLRPCSNLNPRTQIQHHKPQPKFMART